jgi:hypothetical protein
MEANKASDGHDALTDAEWLQVQSDLAAFLDELREAHEVREETDEYVLFADSTGHELNEIAEANGVDRSDLSARMHADARERYEGDGIGDPWSVDDPIIVYKNV